MTAKAKQGIVLICTIVLIGWPLCWLSYLLLLLRIDPGQASWQLRDCYDSTGLAEALIWLLFPPVLLLLILLLRRRPYWLAGIALLCYCLAIAAVVAPRVLTMQRAGYEPANLSILGAAIEIYQADHDGYLPDAYRWLDEIQPYLHHDYSTKCYMDWSNARSSYAMNDNLSGKRIDTDKYKNVILLYETAKPGQNPYGTGSDIPIPARHFLAGRETWTGYGNFFLLADGTIIYTNPKPTLRQAQWAISPEK